ncbi:hypothetical protein PC9H_006062 [Pleurotus ostreatus]|uniref:Glutamate decarboxylase n=1 Tax=Pleurotus ostreatus TaxID=5322 RepID=A0A8H6ZWY2_PLEOS|nr:uncharacterized protein PC9H_006062 [Pleurotus ostreatus]KAF7430357.1 hypothetical protein PC9H_006062 [Pleurotus ostreatus]
MSGDDPELYQRGLPVVSFRLSDDFIKEYPYVKQSWIQSMLRTKGWIGPKGAEDVEILRIVVRETLSEDLVERLVVDILEITESLMTMMEAATSSKGSHQPDAEHGRPDQTNFGSSDRAEQQEQSTFSRQC